MAEKVRLNLVLSEDVNRMVEEIAENAATTKSDVFRRALALMKLAHEGKKQGRHLGLVMDPTKLETEIVGLL